MGLGTDETYSIDCEANKTAGKELRKQDYEPRHRPISRTYALESLVVVLYTLNLNTTS